MSSNNSSPSGNRFDDEPSADQNSTASPDAGSTNPALSSSGTRGGSGASVASVADPKTGGDPSTK